MLNYFAGSGDSCSHLSYHLLRFPIEGGHKIGHSFSREKAILSGVGAGLQHPSHPVARAIELASRPEKLSGTVYVS